MSTFILRIDAPGDGLRVAIKDLIDLAGTPTTAGCRAVAEMAEPATKDAACLAGIRAAAVEGQVRIVGKTNLHELAYGVSGINPWYGTPVNPLDPSLAPGGSSSGSAVAVADNEADVALGTDTGGSIRIPAACCGVTGLKTTWGRISLEGVRPLGPSLDTIGPMARDVAGLVAGMRLLEPGFTKASAAATTIGRLSLPATPVINAAIDRALTAGGFRVLDVGMPGWADATEAGLIILSLEAWEADGSLVHTGGVGADVAQRLMGAAGVTAEQAAGAQATRERWRSEMAAVFDRVEVLAVPTLAEEPPALELADRLKTIRHVIPVNVAGVPAVALPVPTAAHPAHPASRSLPAARRLPACLQLIGPAGAEELLLATAAVIEQAVDPRPT